LKYEFDLEDMRSRLKKTTNELLQHQETQIKDLMADNASLIQHSKKVEDERRAMTEVLSFLYKDAELVKSQLDVEIADYKHTKRQMSDLRRTNFVLWKHIKKLKRKYRKLKVEHGLKDAEELQEEVTDDEEVLKIKQEIELLASDPDLATDLKLLKRETKNFGNSTQDDLLITFYDVDTVQEMIGDEYLIVQRQDAKSKVRRVVHDEEDDPLRTRVEHVGGVANSIVNSI
jgi:hypothetical protein